MAIQGISDKLRSVLRNIDPRRSLVASAMWLIVALAVTFSIAAAVWVGSIARVNVLQQHIRRLALETDQLSSDLSQALSARLDAVRAAGPLLRAANAVGVLYRITRALAELDLDIRSARVQTLGNHVVDAFYVQDTHGQKVGDANLLREIELAILQSLDA